LEDVLVHNRLHAKLDTWFIYLEGADEAVCLEGELLVIILS
jgi:hypothetical protein